MDKKQHKIQLFKFGMYGFLKNLRFFEPYLLFYFTTILGYSYFLSMLLYSISVIIVFLFEIPSGVIADRYGKKLELVFCFLFYISSFIILFLFDQYFMLVIGMMLYGFGEAFRSGTHKSMIMQYLDWNDIEESKTKVYGRTRSMSLIGSMVMSLITIVFVLWLPDIRYLFLFTIVPYSLDLLLILTYPSYLNKRQSEKFHMKEFLVENVRAIKYAFLDKPVRGLLFESSSYQAGFKSIKDYIQPIILTISASVILFKSFSSDENLKIYLGVIYAFIYLISSFASRNAHRVSEKYNNRHTLNVSWLLSGIIMIFMAFFLNNIIIVFVVFLLYYIFLNIRRPLMVELIGNASDPKKRASVLSVESQMVSILVAVFGPILGLIADQSMMWLFITVGIVMMFFFVYKVYFSKHKIEA